MVNGDAKYFVDQLMPNHGRLFSYILKMIPNYSDAEDVMQEVVSLLWKKQSEFTANTDFMAWALSVARFKVYEHYKTVKRGQRQLSSETLRVLDKESLPAIEHEVHLDTVKRCIAKMDLNDYKFIQLRYELDESVSSIAKRFGCSVQNIYQRLTRIHNFLLACVNRQINQEEL